MQVPLDSVEGEGGPRAPVALARAPGRLPYLVRALIKLVTTLFSITLLVFGMVSAAGNPAHDILGMDATVSQVQAFTAKYHLDDPVPVRYAEWVGGLLHGDLGRSYETGAPVTSIIAPRVGRSLLLVGLAWILVVFISVPLGLLAGVRWRGTADVVASVITLCVAAFPEFVLGLILAVIFAVTLGWLPVDSTAVSAGGLLSAPTAYVLPALTIALGSIPYIIRLMRANAREVASETYVRSAVLRGITEPALSLRHIFPNAAPPVVTALGLQLAGMVGGVIVAESLFGFPGLGQLIVQAAASRDAPVVEALALLVGTGFVVVNLVADALVVYLTPRLRDLVR